MCRQDSLRVANNLQEGAIRELRGIAIYTQEAYSRIGDIRDSTRYVADVISKNGPYLLNWVGKYEAVIDPDPNHQWYSNTADCTPDD